MLPILLSLFLAASPAAKPNIVLISVDTLRADHLGCYGYGVPTSPHIDRFASEALLFEDCVCEEPQTGPSFCSIFAARPPRTTGVVRNSVPLPEEVPVVTQAFRAAGYQTAAVVSNWNLKGALSGLDRGFERYEEDFGRRFWGGPRPERDAEAATDLALEILTSRDPARPFFFWFHYMDPHASYKYHAKFHPAGAGLRGLPLREQIRARYDSEIAYADHHLGRLLEALPGENTYVVFMADHGESLLEHGYVGHTRRIHQTTLHIPLIIRGPGIAPGRTSSPARGIDIGATLLGLEGLPLAPGMLGHNLLESPPEASRVRVVETYGGEIPRNEQEREALAGRAPLYLGILHKGWKLIRGEGKEALYSLREDPLETRNIIDGNPSKAAALRELLENWDRDTPHGTAANAELSPEDKRALGAIGYL